MSTFTGDIIVNSADVYTLSGSSLNDPLEVEKVVSQATTVIETLTGVFFRADERDAEIQTSDAAWLKKAVILQSVWMLEQVDILSRQSVSSISQDGLSLQAPDSLTFVLAPLAKRALKNCSWTKTGTMRVAAPSEATPVGSFLTDDSGVWTPIASA